MLNECPEERLVTLTSFLGLFHLSTSLSRVAGRPGCVEALQSQELFSGVGA